MAQGYFDVCIGERNTQEARIARTLGVCGVPADERAILIGRYESLMRNKVVTVWQQGAQKPYLMLSPVKNEDGSVRINLRVLSEVAI